MSIHSILTHFDSYHFFFSIYIPNFLYSPYLIPFILIPIHFYSSSDPPYPKPTPHSMPYLGLAEAGPTIPKSGNWWHSKLKTRRSQDWMHQFRVFLGRTESHDRGEDVGGNGEGRKRGDGAVFPFPSFSISFQYIFPFSPWFFHFLLAVCFVVFRRSSSPYLRCIYHWVAGWCGYLT